jgi:deoxyribodipyrimidine photo-lyase
VIINQKARQVLADINPINYATQRNYLGGSTQLSTYITRGILTLPQIKESILDRYTVEDCYKLIFELAWREYWQREWTVRGDSIFSDIKATQKNTVSDLLPAAIFNADTSINAIDAGIRQLYKTGYIDNHMRLWISGLTCNVAHTNWRQPAAWMYYHLLDGDPASNSLSWQWVAGTFSSKNYLPAQVNINKYSRTIQSGTFLDQSYEALAEIETPNIMSARKSIELVWTAPKTNELIIDIRKPTLLYHSFWLNSDWHKDLDANRVLVLEKSWFAQHPVSAKVTESILTIANEIRGMQIYVGDIEHLKTLLRSDVRYVGHPSLSNWPGLCEPMPMLFPSVALKSFNSFMSYWKQCEKNL